MTLRIGSIFSGTGGLDIAVANVFGAEPVWFSEVDPAACKTLAHNWPDVPNLGSVTEIHWPTVPPVDIIAGGSPCQDLSLAGAKKGMDESTRSGLWFEMLRAIRIIKPKYVVWENVKGALSARASSDLGWTEGLLDERPESEKPKKENDHAVRALGRVLGDLSESGYDAKWTTVSAAEAGAPHLRERVFVLATLAGGQP